MSWLRRARSGVAFCRAPPRVPVGTAGPRRHSARPQGPGLPAPPGPWVTWAGSVRMGTDTPARVQEGRAMRKRSGSSSDFLVGSRRDAEALGQLSARVRGIVAVVVDLRVAAGIRIDTRRRDVADVLAEYRAVDVAVAGATGVPAVDPIHQPPALVYA